MVIKIKEGITKKEFQAILQELEKRKNARKKFDAFKFDNNTTKILREDKLKQ